MASIVQAINASTATFSSSFPTTFASVNEGIVGKIVDSAALPCRRHLRPA
jgi:hypothetical protein